MDPDISKWPLVYQVLAALGAAITGVLMWLRGSKSAPPPQPNGNGGASFNAAVDQRFNALDQAIRDIWLEIKAMRADCRIVVEAEKEALDNRFRDAIEAVEKLKDRVHEIETFKAVIEDRDHRPRGR